MELFVKSQQGNMVNIKDFKKSLHDFPTSCRKNMDNHGMLFLENCSFFTHPCGCEIGGNGTIQFPLKIVYCQEHKDIEVTNQRMKKFYGL